MTEFEHWLENRVKEYFNPIENIITNNELRKREKAFKSTVNGTYLPSTNEDNDPCRWLCKQKHRLMNCLEFINKSLEEKKKFIVQNRLCWNCLSKSHFVQNCNSHFRCKIDNCKQLHHTLLHETSPNPPSTINKATINSHSVKPHAFLQIIPVIISNGSRTFTTNAFLDSGSYSTLISKGLAENLNLNGVTKALKIRNVVNSEVSYVSNLVNLFISSNQHPKANS